MHTLSKSRYTAFHQCPKLLWLRVHKPEAVPEDPALQARLEQGNEVGDLAMQYFGDYDEVTTLRGGKLDIASMIKKTDQCMRRGVDNICEASFDFEGNYCAVDILHKDGRGWAIYEVKSTTLSASNPDIKKIEKYFPDIAYQKWVLDQCGVKVTGAYLLCLNSDYRREKRLDIQDMFVAIDVSRDILGEYGRVDAEAREAMKVVNSKTEPDIDLSEDCYKPYPCAFFDYCKRQHGISGDDPSVFDVYRMSGKDKIGHYKQDRITFEKLRGQRLNPTQRMQVENTLNNTEEINRRGIRDFLDSLSCPLYFLDFETMQSAVAEFEGTKPYQQIPFQYSLHIAKRLGRYDHLEFLAESDGSDPRRELAEQLCRDIPANVCVVAYNMEFERRCIKELAEAFPDLSGHLMCIHKNIQDLLEPFRAGYYYVPAMGGSFSIKSVLPALFPNDPDLDYHNLKGDVHTGSEAMNTFPKIKDMSWSQARRARKDLLKYCELDTWAMVKIWEKLNEVAR